jgi:hypothetical protein
MEINKELIKSYQRNFLKNNAPEIFSSRSFSEVPSYNLGDTPLIRDISRMISNSGIQTPFSDSIEDVISNVDKFLTVSPMMCMHKIPTAGIISFPSSFKFCITSLEDNNRLCIINYSPVMDEYFVNRKKKYSIEEVRSQGKIEFFVVNNDEGTSNNDNMRERTLFWRLREEKRFYFNLNDPKLIELMYKKSPDLENTHLLMKKILDDDLSNLILLNLGPDATNFIMVPTVFLLDQTDDDGHISRDELIRARTEILDYNPKSTLVSEFDRYNIGRKEYNKIISNGQYIKSYGVFSLYYLENNWGFNNCGFNGEKLDPRRPMSYILIK